MEIGTDEHTKWFDKRPQNRYTETCGSRVSETKTTQFTRINANFSCFLSEKFTMRERNVIKWKFGFGSYFAIFCQ